MSPASYAERHALVIGNKNYAKDSLSNPINDAKDMAALLKQKGFEVTVLINANRQEMKKGISRLTRQLYQKGAVGLFYYAGHGVSINGRNYLIPVDADINNESEVEFESIDAGRVLAGMENAGNKLNMVILDACRNNPFGNGFRDTRAGLSRMNSAEGTLVLFAAKLGQAAIDGSGRNGLFTKHLMNAMKSPGLKAEDVFKQAARQVYKATKGKQLPWQAGVMLGDFYFTENKTKVSKIAPSSEAANRQQSDHLFWESIKFETDIVYFQGYLKEYPNGIYANLARIKILAHSSSKALELTGLAHLTVNAFPNNARVRILNIKPKYKPGIELPPGRYHIEVSSPGYQRYTKWIKLAAESKQQNIVLIERTKPISVATRSKSLDTAITPKKTPQKETETKTGIEMIWVDSGCFQMGRTGGDEDETEHEVCLTQSYYLGKYEVTQSLWQKVMGNQPAFFKQCGADCPVENVSWNDVQKFIRRLNRNSGLKYRLPTEAEWEFACRGGNNNQTYCGDNWVTMFNWVIGDSWVDEVAWYNDNSDNKTHPVGTKKANDLGFFDMSGNVWEWVTDWYSNRYYQISPLNDPKGPSSGSYRVLRGGGWYNENKAARSVNRGNNSPQTRSSSLGFRLARTK